MKYFFLIAGLICFAGCESPSRAAYREPPAGSPPPQIASADDIAAAVAGRLSGVLDAQAVALQNNNEVLEKLTGQIAVMNSQNKKTGRPETTGTAVNGSRAPLPPPVVWVVGPQNCPPCDMVISEGNQDGRFQFVKRNPNPVYDSIAANNGGYPVVVFATFEGPKYICPYKGVDDLLARYQRFNGAAVVSFPDERKQPLSTGGLMRAAPLYYSGQAEWDWPGDIRYHLMQPPHSLPAARVQRMTDAECIRVHNAHHNGNWRADARPANKSLRADYVAAKHKLRADYHAAKHQNKAVAAQANMEFQVSRPNVLVRTWRWAFGDATTRRRAYSRNAGVCPSC